MILHSPEITQDIAHLQKNDPLFDKFFAKYPYELDAKNLQKRNCNFAAFADAVISQQLSVKAAATIQARVEACTGEITPENILLQTDADLRACGLSGRKIEYLKGMAQAEIAGQFKPQDLERMPDEEIIEKITQLRGFGVWTAHMVLIFNLARRDVFPSLDLGVIEGMRILRNLKTRPDVLAAERYARKWTGKKTAASLLLWHVNAQYKKAMKKS